MSVMTLVFGMFLSVCIFSYESGNSWWYSGHWSDRANNVQTFHVTEYFISKYKCARYTNSESHTRCRKCAGQKFLVTSIQVSDQQIIECWKESLPSRETEIYYCHKNTILPWDAMKLITHYSRDFLCNTHDKVFIWWPGSPLLESESSHLGLTPWF
jgi:hypothetical protein